MRALLIVMLVAGCEGKRTETKATAPVVSPRAAAPVRAAPAPSLPSPPVTHKLGHEAFVWSFAEASNTVDAWDAAAAAYEDELAACESDCGETAYAILLARKNALMLEPIDPPEGEEPIAELPPRVQATLDALDQYVAVGGPDDPDVDGARFLGASLTWKWRQPDAVERLTAILRFHRNHPTAEYAANQLLDLLMRQERMDELRGWVVELLADAAFLADKAELRATLETLRGKLGA